MARELPKYMALVGWVKDQIIGNHLPYGEKFYSENEIGEMFGVSRQTVRQAIGILEQEGFVERRRGSGTYVVYGSRKSRQPTMNIGVISTYLDSYIFPAIIKGIDLVLAGQGYTMQLVLTHNKVENETRALTTMLEKDVDGIIVEPTKSGLPNPNTALYGEIRARKIPLLFFNAYYPGMDFPHVSLNDRAAGQMAARCLIRAGHRKIAGMFQSDDLQGHLRYAGYVDALTEAGIEVNSGNILWFVTEDIPYLAEDFHRIERCLRDCTGMVCYNDQIASGIVPELRKNGILIPDMLSVTGIDNAEIAALCEVPLTTVAHPMEKLGETAARNILRLIADPLFDATIEFDPRLVRRSSVRELCTGLSAKFEL